MLHDVMAFSKVKTYCVYMVVLLLISPNVCNFLSALLCAVGYCYYDHLCEREGGSGSSLSVTHPLYEMPL